MATSTLPSEQYFAHDFVESAGAILFRLSDKTVCVSHQLKWDEYSLAKGRRNVNESRHAAALREVSEETGWPIRPLPLDLMARCTPEIELQWNDDRPRFYEDTLEPFAVQTRKMKEGHMKFFWWYVAALEEDQPRAEVDEKESAKASSDFYSYDEAVKLLTYENDRAILRQAIELVEKTYNKQLEGNTDEKRKSSGKKRKNREEEEISKSSPKKRAKRSLISYKM